VLSDRERRLLDELERGLALDAPEPARSHVAGRRRRPWARTTSVLVALAVTVTICAVLLITGAGAAVLPLAGAAALVGLLWYGWPYLKDAADEGENA
jgi:hypothetical protein